MSLDYWFVLYALLFLEQHLVCHTINTKANFYYADDNKWSEWELIFTESVHTVQKTKQVNSSVKNYTKYPV